MPIVANNTVEKTKVQQLQNKLYRAAKSSRSRRFHALYDKLWRIDVLERAWFEVAKNRGGRVPPVGARVAGMMPVATEHPDRWRQQHGRPVLDDEPARGDLAGIG